MLIDVYTQWLAMFVEMFIVPFFPQIYFTGVQVLYMKAPRTHLQSAYYNCFLDPISSELSTTVQPRELHQRQHGNDVLVNISPVSCIYSRKQASQESNHQSPLPPPFKYICTAYRCFPDIHLATLIAENMLSGHGTKSIIMAGSLDNLSMQILAPYGLGACCLRL